MRVKNSQTRNCVGSTLDSDLVFTLFTLSYLRGKPKEPNLPYFIYHRQGFSIISLRNIRQKP